MCIDAPNCEAFNLWGAGDRASYLIPEEAGSPEINKDFWKWHNTLPNPLILDWLYDPKPAFYAIRDLLLKS